MFASVTLVFTLFRHGGGVPAGRMRPCTKCAQTWQVGLGKLMQAEVERDQTPSRRAPGASMAQWSLDLFDSLSVLECRGSMHYVGCSMIETMVKPIVGAWAVAWLRARWSAVGTS